MSARVKINKLICTILLGAVALLFALPLVWMILASVKHSNEVFSQNWFPAAEWKWNNYEIVWTDSTVSLAKSYMNSIMIVILGTGGMLLLSSMCAYGFAKVNFKGKNIIFVMFMAAMMIPNQVTIIPRYMLFFEIDLYNTLWALILPAWFNVTTIFLLRQFYLGLPDDLTEAAKMDGAGHFRIFLQILLPLTKPAMVSAGILSFIHLWNDYLSALIFLVKKNLYTVAQVVRYWLADNDQPYELVMATATSIIVPVVILFIFCQKHFVEGIATSGVKG